MIGGIVACIIFLFVLYVHVKDDFIFLRRNVTLEEIFNITFIGVPVVLLLSRLAYVALHPSIRYLNPLVFFILPYFPGLSLSGGILGAAGFLFFYTKEKRVPSLRLADIYSLSYIAACACYFLLAGIFAIHAALITGIIAMVLSCLYIISYVLSQQLFSHGRFADGAIIGIVLIMDSLLRILYTLITMFIHKKFILQIDIIFPLVTLIIGLSLFISIYLRSTSKSTV